jgi:two-component system, OmpR family, response regulator
LDIQRIMIIDDDESMLQLEEMALAQIGGLQVCGCLSGNIALAQIQEFNPDVILLDANMPEKSGPETLEAIRQIEAFQDTPIIFVTGDSREQEVSRLKSLGALDVIVKPFDPMTISEQVKLIVGSLND